MKPFQQKIVSSNIYIALKRVEGLVYNGYSAKTDAEYIVKDAEKETGEMYFPYSNSPAGLIAAANWYIAAYDKNENQMNKEVVIENNVTVIPYKAFDIIVYRDSAACYFTSLYGGNRTRVYDPCCKTVAEDFAAIIEWVGKQ